MNARISLLSVVISGCIAALAPLALYSADAQPETQFKLTTEPEGAQVLIDHVKRGETPLSLTDLKPGYHLVQCEKAGYRTLLESVQLEKGVPRALTLKLEPLTGLVLITSTPPDSEVSLNSASLGRTPLLVSTLPPGTHRLALSAPGYQNKEVEVTVEDRTPVKLDVALLSDSGTLDAQSDPGGAEVKINGIVRGKTPCKIDRIPRGTVTVEVTAAGFETYSGSISLAAGEVQTLNAKLKPQPGTLRIVSIPEKARVYINDEFQGETPFDFANAQPGAYRVRMEKTGFEPVARTVTIEKGSSATEEFRLVRVLGRVEIATAPAGATIFIDGKKSGITNAKATDTTALSDPLAIEDILEGEHTVEVTRKGFATQKKTIKVTRDQTSSVLVRLVRQFIPNYEVVTTRSVYRGVLEFSNEEGIRIETAPGVSQTIPMRDVKKHGPLREGE